MEEALRFDAPEQRNFRRVKACHEFRGAALDEGSLVFQLIGSANRDADQLPDPDKFDISRRRNPHVSFGSGIHSCLAWPWPASKPVWSYGSARAGAKAVPGWPPDGLAGAGAVSRAEELWVHRGVG